MAFIKYAYIALETDTDPCIHLKIHTGKELGVLEVAYWLEGTFPILVLWEMVSTECETI